MYVGFLKKFDRFNESLVLNQNDTIETQYVLVFYKSLFVFSQTFFWCIPGGLNDDKSPLIYQ